MKSRLLPILLILFIAAVLVQQNRRALRKWWRSVNPTTIEEIRASESPAENAAGPIAEDLEWPQWRGPERNNHARPPFPPLPFSFEKHKLWQAKIPGRGHASPVIDTDQVYILSGEEEGETIKLLAFACEDGATRWTQPLSVGGFEKRHAKNTHASATPACDGEAIYCVYLQRGALRVTQVKRNGELGWQSEAGPYASYHGYGGSPILWKSLVIVGGDSLSRGFIAALDRGSGKLVWRTAREEAPSHCTPALVRCQGRDVVVLTGQQSVTAYDPQTGDKLWQTPGSAEETANTAAFNDTLVFATAGYPQTSIQALRGDTGEEVWQRDLNLYVPSPLVFNDRLLVTQDNGVARLLIAETGKDRWTKRLGGDITASPVLCGDTVLLPNESGRMFFFRAADKFEARGEVDFGAPIFATPAVAGGRLFVRTDETTDKTGARVAGKLYCIGAKSGESSP